MHRSSALPNFLGPSVKTLHHSLDKDKPPFAGRPSAAFDLSMVGQDVPNSHTRPGECGIVRDLGQGVPNSHTRPGESGLVYYVSEERQCGVCGQKFSSMDACKRHKQKHEASGFKHCCILCLKKFYRRDALQSHLRKRHKLSIWGETDELRLLARGICRFVEKLGHCVRSSMNRWFVLCKQDCVIKRTDLKKMEDRLWMLAGLKLSKKCFVVEFLLA